MPLTNEPTMPFSGGAGRAGVPGRDFTCGSSPVGWARTAGPVTGLQPDRMQQALASVGPGSLPFSGFYSMNDLMAKTLATQRIEVALLGTMAGPAPPP